MHNSDYTNKQFYQANTTLIPLDPTKEPHIYVGEFGIIWGIRKPHGLATTKGIQVSLLDLLITRYAHHPLIQGAIKEFGIEEELGMLTRLDNDTAGMVWFAYTHEGKSLRLQSQSKGEINKIYEADVIGRVKENTVIDTPIMHHRYNDRKMITINTTSDTDKGRGHIHQVSTYLIPGEISGNNTHIQAIIHQGCRHQIRLHCASNGNPILGDVLYHRNYSSDFLHLWSVGVERDKIGTAVVIDYHTLLANIIT